MSAEAPQLRVEQGKTYYSNVPLQPAKEPKKARLRPVGEFLNRAGAGASRAASRTARETVATAKVGRRVGGIARRTLTTDPYEQARKLDIQLELARRKAALRRLNQPRFRIRPHRKTEVQRLRLEVDRLRREVRRLRA